MKILTFFGIIISIISFVLFNSISPCDTLYFILMISFLLICMYSMLKEKESLFLISFFTLIYLSINMFKFRIAASTIFLITYLIGLIVSFIYGIKYILGFNYEKIIKLNMIKKPKKQEYMICKYITGLNCKVPGNCLIKKDNECYCIEIENEKENKIINDTIKIKDIKNINVISTPLVVGMNSKNRLVKPIESFRVIIKTKKEKEITFLFLKNPKKFLELE